MSLAGIIEHFERNGKRSFEGAIGSMLKFLGSHEAPWMMANIGQSIKIGSPEKNEVLSFIDGCTDLLVSTVTQGCIETTREALKMYAGVGLKFDWIGDHRFQMTGLGEILTFDVEPHWGWMRARDYQKEQEHERNA